MLTRLRVENYQSIGSADLELGPLNVIVGPGTMGKSALLRALSALIFNETGTDFMRKGTTHTQVVVELDGRRIIWDRDAKGGASYAIEGIGDVLDSQEFHKLGGAVPEEVAALLGMKAVEIDRGFSLTPQIHGQWDQPLLLMESASKVARALAQMTKLAVLVEAQVASARDLRKAKQEITRQAQAAAELTARLATMADTAEAERLVSEATVALDEANERYDAAAAAAILWSTYQAARSRQDITLPDREELDRLDEEVADLERAASVLDSYQEATQQAILLESELEEVKETLAEYEGALETALSGLKVCPLCGTVLGRRKK